MAEELARSSGTPEDVLQRVLGQDFLMKCLRKAKFSADLLQDTMDACEINDLNALVLGSGLLSVTEASEKLFLMQDEAATAVSVCRKECLRAGVNYGDGAKLTPEELAEDDDDGPATPTPAPAPAQPAAPAHPAIKIPQAPSHPPSNHVSPGANDVKLSGKLGGDGATPTSTAPAQPSVPTPATEPLPSASAVVEVASSEPAAAPPRDIAATTSVDPNFLIKPPVSTSGAAPTPGAATGPASGTPYAGRSHIPKPSAATPATPAAAVATPRERPVAKPVTRASPSTTLATPPTSSGGAATVTPAMNGRHTPAVSSSSARPPRPSTAPLTARASTTAPLGKDRPFSALVTPPPQPSKLPSYAKPTASHKARLLKEDSDVPSTSAAPPITFASTNKPLRRLLYMPPRPTSTTPEEKKEPKKPMFDNIRSNLLRPTAAFLAWSSGKSKPTKDSDLRTSQSLQGEVSGLSRSVRAPNSAPPRNMAREFSATTGTALSPSISQSGMKPTTTPEPFRLASAERHLKAQEELQRKKEEKARLESHIPKFKASPMPSSGDRSKGDTKRTMSAQTDA